jgi:hypothetical protein
MRWKELNIAAVLLMAGTWPAAQGQTPAGILEKAAAQAEQFTERFPGLTCTEKLTQIKFGQGEKIANRRESVFDYLILMETVGDEFNVQESRLEKSRPQKDPPQALLATTGFAVMQVVFHPHFQSSYKFEEMAPETSDGIAWRRLRFEHLAGHSSPTVLEVKGREYPIAWRGTAWLHPATGAVRRIQTELREPLPDIGLLSLSSVVDYDAASSLIPVWVPRLAVVEARTAHQHWRNQHEFSAYRRFEVNVQQKLQELKQP